jgi:vacuolar-type H+-ATPase subunit C/Vma6
MVRVVAARGKIIRAEQLADLIRCTSIEEFKQKLAGFDLDLPADAISNSKDLEKTFHDIFFKYINLIIYNAPHECQEFVIQYIEKYAIDNLKTLVVGKILDMDEKDLEEHINLPVERIMKTEGLITEAVKHAKLEKMLYIYKQTKYGALLKDLVSQYTKTKEIFFIYALLDRYYIENLNFMLIHHAHWSNIDKNFAKTFVGTLTDFYNIMCAFRGQINGFSQAEIRIIKTPVQFEYQVHDDDFNRLYSQGSDREKIVGVLKDILSRYPGGGEYVGLISPDRITTSLHQFFYNIFLRHVRLLRFEPGHELGEVLAFLLEKEAEIDNLITIFEGVKNDIEPQTINSMLRLRR